MRAEQSPEPNFSQGILKPYIHLPIHSEIFILIFLDSRLTKITISMEQYASIKKDFTTDDKKYLKNLSWSVDPYKEEYTFKQKH